jgi:MazG family protein
VSRRPIDQLLEVMRRLRDPDGGCPWDQQQTFETIAPYTIEEAYEVADAVASGDREALKDELGDLLLQVVFHAQIAEDERQFDFDDVARAIVDKLIRRHPHVFGETTASDAETVHANWEKLKAAERAAKRADGVLDGIPLALPALLRALKLQKRAARVGFDWKNPLDVLDKMEEEIAELRAELAAGSGVERVREEFGDLLFVLVNLGRHLDLDPETALRATNAKFERRFRSIEAALAEEGRRPEQASLDEMEALWIKAKLHERATKA